MAMAVLFSLGVVSAGFAALRTLGLARGMLALGLAPASGLAVLAIAATWLILLGAPPPLPGALVLALAVGGLAMAWSDRRTIGDAVSALLREQRLAGAMLVAALAVPMLVMGVAFAGVQVPLSPHDGAAHTEAIQAHRLGQTFADWYPPGLTALFGAWLQLFPWLDSARGAFELGMSLPLLAALAVSGLGVAVWRDLRMAAASALLLGSTYLYPYFPELWSGWPLATSLVLAISLWTVGLEYLRTVGVEYLPRPSWRWAMLAGLQLGGVVLVHGSELYTLAIVLAIVLIGGWRRVVWRRLAGHVGLAVAVALTCAAVYLPALFHWAGSGGAYAVGLDDGQVLQAVASVSVSAGPDPFGVFALGSLGIDLPLRVVLLAIGVGWAFRQRRGRSVLAVGLAFAAIATIFSLLSRAGVIHQLYAVLFPWGMHYRLFMMVALAQVLLAGAGGVVALRWVGGLARRPGATARRLGRVTRLGVASWMVLVTWGMSVFLAYPSRLVLGYSGDDEAAMGWLRAHAAAGEVLINDGYADAGIWAPYKAGVPILLPRWGPSSVEAERRGLVIDNVARLDQEPAAAAVACELHARYVLRGSRVSGWDARRFPELAELRASPALEEVFSSGEAVVFRTRLECPY